MKPETVAADVAASASDPMRPGSRTAHKDPRLSVLPACLDESAWFDALQCIDRPAARTLSAALRTLYPHDGFDDAVYRRVVVAFDRVAMKSPPVLQWLGEFTADIDRAAPLPFMALSESYRVAALKGIEHKPAFRFVQRAGVRYLYDDIEVWDAFGYEGASYHLGGYVQRGFDDLDWLPPIPEAGR